MTVMSTMVVMLALSSAPSPVSDATFKAKSALASANAKSDAGKAYDEALGKAVNSSPDFPAKASACLRQFPGDRSVQGYFEFGATQGYRLVLRPDDGFGRCFARALEGHAVPAPPRRPYLNPFAFTNHPGRPAVQKLVITKDMLREPDGSPLKPATPPTSPGSKPATTPTKTP